MGWAAHMNGLCKAWKVRLEKIWPTLLRAYISPKFILKDKCFGPTNGCSAYPLNIQSKSLAAHPGFCFSEKQADFEDFRSCLIHFGNTVFVLKTFAFGLKQTKRENSCPNLRLVISDLQDITRFNNASTKDLNRN